MGFFAELREIFKVQYDYSPGECPYKGTQPNYSTFGFRKGYICGHRSSGEDSVPHARCNACGVVVTEADMIVAKVHGWPNHP